MMKCRLSISYRTARRHVAGIYRRAFFQTLKELQESARERRGQKEDMDFNFALEVAGRLKRMTPRQNALANLQIQQLLFNIEFPGQQVESYHVNVYEF